ncbi:hypothetical protein [Spirobacillus cienkowskii]|uniref:hypothetical protein n=1 Tax=Spirobacillus cienkowskii TaxID=495820 RepID=UPI0030CC23B6
MKSRIGLKFIALYLFVIIFITESCSPNKIKFTKITINQPNHLNSSLNNKSSYLSIRPIQIPVSMKNNSGFLLNTELKSGTNSLSLPIGKISIKIGFLAMGYTTTTPSNCSNTNSNNNSENETENVLYTEFETELTIDENTTSIPINFPNPFNIVTFDKFGFKIKNILGNPAAGATIYYIDPISGIKLSDPCTQTPFSDTADSEGRVAINIPIYSNSSQFHFEIVSTDGIKQTIQPTLTKNASVAKFYNLFMVDGSYSPMNEATDSFLNNQQTIAYRRDVLLRNPRFPDIANYSIQAPNSTTGMFNLYPSSITNNSNELINKRKFKFQCEIKLSSGTIIYQMQSCKNFYSNFFTEPVQLSQGQSYTISAYINDEEGFLASDKSATTPATVSFTYNLP